MKNIVLLLVAVMLLCVLASATTLSKIQATCPVCTNQFAAYVLNSTNSFGGQDRDFLTYAVGSQPVWIRPITCSQCLYSGYAGDFEKELTPEQRDKFAQKNSLKPLLAIAPGTDYREIPAWVRYDLIAQVYTILERDKGAIADQYLNASWAVRMSGLPISDILGNDVLTSIDDKISASYEHTESRKKNRALYEIDLAGKLKDAGQSLAEDEMVVTCLSALILFRNHGENSEAETCLSLAKTAMFPEKYAQLEKAFHESVARERDFQRKAAQLFAMVLAEKEASEEYPPAIVLYLCGELQRRLENWKEAGVYYDSAVKEPNVPDWLLQYMEEQKKLLPKE